VRNFVERVGRRRCALTGVIAAGACLSGWAQSVQFQENSGDCGIDASYGLPLSVGALPMYGGGSAGDFNRDGFQDLYIPLGGAGPDKLYINNGDGTFTDQAADWGVAATCLSVSGAVGDYDHDGWPDLYVTSFGNGSTRQPGAHRLYHNNGDGTFTDVADAAGVRFTSPSVGDGFGAAWGDYDLDGDLDLAVAGWFQNSNGNKLFRNNGDGTFTDVTASAVLFNMMPVRGFTPRFVDMNRDRYPELLWIADYGTSKYFVNNADGTFTEHTAQSSVGIETNGMGQTIGDFNNDGRLDWYVTSIYYDSGPIGNPNGNMLYLNQGGDVYFETSRIAHVNNGGWGWGVVAVDLNHDGWLDIVENNGWWTIEFIGEPMYAWLNVGTGLDYSNAGPAIGLSDPYDGRGLLNFDMDNDGDQDLVLFGWSDPVRVYRCNLLGANANWLRVFLDTTDRPDLAPDGIGSRVTVRANGLTQVRHLDGGGNYLSQSETSAHFGLAGAQNVAELRIRWASGEQTILTNVAVNQTITIAAPRISSGGPAEPAVRTAP
jgi:hypothetical protein